MGLKCLSDLAQAAMKNVLAGIEDSNVYIYDVDAFSTTLDKHVELLETILQRLCKNGFIIDSLKCEQQSKISIGLVIGLLLMV